MGPNLLNLLKSSFNESELEDLCHELNINCADLPVPRLAGRADRMRALVQFCRENGRLSQLVDTCRRLLPNIPWPDPATLGSDQELYGETEARLPFEPETVAIPAGTFLMGSDDQETSPAAQPQHPLTLDYYRIGKYPITVAQYAKFIEQNREQPPPPPGTGWFGKTPPTDRLDHPVVGVSWHDARAYCRWLNEQTGKAYRLLTEAEWEKAARGGDGRPFPWGREWSDAAANAGSAGTSPVTAYEDFASPFGCVDMLGNVSEWTTTIWGDRRKTPDFTYPYLAHDGREDLEANQQNSRLRRVCRGGGFDAAPGSLRCSSRAQMRAGSVRSNLGFRVALEP